MAEAHARDCYVVDTEPLAGLVRGFVSTWQRTRPSTGGRFAGRNAVRDEVPNVDPLDWLAQESDLPRDVIAGLVAKDRNDRPTRTRPRRPTGLQVADQLVTLIGCPEAFHDGTLTVRRNSQASKRSCGRCWTADDGCSDDGSALTGVA